MALDPEEVKSWFSLLVELGAGGGRTCSPGYSSVLRKVDVATSSLPNMVEGGAEGI